MTKEAVSQSVFERYLKKWNARVELVMMGLMLLGVWAIGYVMTIAIGILDKEVLRQQVLGIPMIFYVVVGLLCFPAAFSFNYLMKKYFLEKHYFIKLYLPDYGPTYFLMSNGRCLAMVEFIEVEEFPEWFRARVKQLNFDNQVKRLLKIPNYENNFSLEIQMTTNSRWSNWVKFFDNVCDPQRELTEAQDNFIEQIVAELMNDFPVNLTEQELQAEFVRRIPEIKKIMYGRYYSQYWVIENMRIMREVSEEVDLTFVRLFGNNELLLDNSAQQGEVV